MPHQTIEYSENVAARTSIDALVERLHAEAASIDALPVAGLRTRAAPRAVYRIADGHTDNAFVHVTLRIAPGRSMEVRKEAGERLFAVLCDAVADAFDTSPLALSFEIQEIDAELRWKKNNLRSYLASRTEEN